MDGFGPSLNWPTFFNRSGLALPQVKNPATPTVTPAGSRNSGPWTVIIGPWSGGRCPFSKRCAAGRFSLPGTESRHPAGTTAGGDASTWRQPCLALSGLIAFNRTTRGVAPGWYVPPLRGYWRGAGPKLLIIPARPVGQGPGKDMQAHLCHPEPHPSFLAMCYRASTSLLRTTSEESRVAG